MLSEHKEVKDSAVTLIKSHYHLVIFFEESPELRTDLWFLVKSHIPKSIDNIYKLARTISTNDPSHYYGTDYVYQQNEVLFTLKQSYLSDAELKFLRLQCAKKLYGIVYSKKSTSVEMDNNAKKYAEEIDNYLSQSIATDKDMRNADARLKSIDLKVYEYWKILYQKGTSAGVSINKWVTLRDLTTSYRDFLLVKNIPLVEAEATRELEEAKEKFFRLLSTTQASNKKIDDFKQFYIKRALSVGITSELMRSLEQLEICYRNFLPLQNGVITDNTIQEKLEQEKKKFDQLIEISRFKTRHKSHGLLLVMTDNETIEHIERMADELAEKYQIFLLEKDATRSQAIKKELETKQDAYYEYIADIQTNDYLDDINDRMIMKGIPTNDQIESQKDKIKSLYFNQVKTLIGATDISIKTRALSALEKAKRKLSSLIKEQYNNLYRQKRNPLTETKPMVVDSRAAFTPILRDTETSPLSVHQKSSPDSISDERSISSLSSLSEVEFGAEITFENKECQLPFQQSSTTQILAEIEERKPLAPISQGIILVSVFAKKQPVEIISASPLKQCSAFKPVAPKPIDAGKSATTILGIQPSVS